MSDLIETADVVRNRRLRERAAGAAARLPVGRVHSRDEHADAGRAGAGALGLPETATAGLFDLEGC
jgi:hypothetical protein